MVRTGGVQDVLDLIGLAVGPLAVHGATELDERTPNAEEAEGDDGLLIDDVKLVGDGED